MHAVRPAGQRLPPRDANRKEILDRLGRHLGVDQAESEGFLEKALGFQPLQSLSHRGPADPKPKRQHTILDPAALRQDATNDRFAKRAVDKFAQEAPLDEADLDLHQMRSPRPAPPRYAQSQVLAFSVWLCAERWFMRRRFGQRDPATLTIDIQQ